MEKSIEYKVSPLKILILDIIFQTKPRKTNQIDESFPNALRVYLEPVWEFVIGPDSYGRAGAVAEQWPQLWTKILTGPNEKAKGPEGALAYKKDMPAWPVGREKQLTNSQTGSKYTRNAFGKDSSI